MTAAVGERLVDRRLGPRRVHRGKEPAEMRWRLSELLRVPLLGKILGANLLLIFLALLAHAALPSTSVAAPLGVALALSFIATSALVWLALAPIKNLEATAERVSLGDYSARVPASRVADRQIARLSSTMNRLLDRVNLDRERINYLAGRSVRARDIERESVARELRESFAQSITAINLHVAATEARSGDRATAERLEEVREMLSQVVDDMRSVAETLYPGTLGEFGLRNALEALARRVARRSHLRIEVDADAYNATLTPGAASALFRVAEEAFRNIEQHARATRVRLTLRSDPEVLLEIDDDGRGIELKLNDPLQAGLGLFSARTVLALIGGDLQISSAPERGTRVTARIPAKGQS
jgi:signal transduction histidine kinase